MEGTRYTGDLDIWIRPQRDNITRLIAALDAFGFAALGISVADFMIHDAAGDGAARLSARPHRSIDRD